MNIISLILGNLKLILVVLVGILGYKLGGYVKFRSEMTKLAEMGDEEMKEYVEKWGHETS